MRVDPEIWRSYERWQEEIQKLQQRRENLAETLGERLNSDFGEMEPVEEAMGLDPQHGFVASNLAKVIA